MTTLFDYEPTEAAPVFDEQAQIETVQFEPVTIDQLLTPQFDATSGLLLGLDTTDVNQLRGLNFFWAAGYAGGWWPTYHPLCLAYPALYKAGRLFSYAVSEVEDADWCDCEKGDLTVPQVPPWLSRQFARGHKKPGVYADLDTWTHGGLLDLLAHYGSNIVRICAWYTFTAQIRVSWADCQQFTDRYANRNVDGNVAKSSMFAPSPPHRNNVHYERFPTGPFPTAKWGKLNERLVVEEYDGARQHPDKFKSYLPQLQTRLQWLANRCAYLAIHVHKKPDGKPNWADNYYGWRFQQLIHRAQGSQFV